MSTSPVIQFSTSFRRPLNRWRSRWHALREQRRVIAQQWVVQREIENAVSGDGLVVIGPWLSEVGYEVLYWVPFVRWVQQAYRIPAERLVVISRGGTASWYGDITARYIEAFDFVTPSDLATRAQAGELKQRTVTALDRAVIDRALPDGDRRDARVLHPSLMFRWFAPFWSGHEPLAFVERHTRHRHVTAPDETPLLLPQEYAVVKFYSARALPDAPVVREQLRSIVDGLAARMPVVQLDTGVDADEHADLRVEGDSRVLSVAGLLDPRTNLGAQTAIIARARLFVGTCGSLAWLAPLLGVNTIPLFTDASFLHAHLHVARRAYGRIAAGRFAPIDLSGLLDTGLMIRETAAAMADTRTAL